VPPDLKLATHLTQSSLFWRRHVEIGLYLEQLERLMQEYPTKLIAPVHDSVIDDVDVIMPLMREAHCQAFVG
jgi:hypothetical protein